MTTQNELQKRRSMLSDSKKALMEKRLQRQVQPTAIVPVIPRRAPDAIIPASFAQQRLWFLDQLEPGSTAYNMPIALRLHGKLNIAAFRDSLNAIIRRHEVLRATFANVDGVPVQQIQDTMVISLPVVDLQHYPQEQRTSEVTQRMVAEAEAPFNLATGHLLRGQLLQSGEFDYIFLLTMHHIISDAWSTGIFYQELITLYEAACADKPEPLAALPVQYADYACWQQKELQGPILEQQLAYWKRQFEHLPDPIALPIDHPRPTVQNFHGAKYTFSIPPEVAKAARQLCQQEGITLFMLIMAAFLGVLSRYTGQNDMVLGTSIANRTLPELEGLIGFFSNTLALRTDHGGNPTVRELFGRVRKVALDAYANQDVPFERALEHPLQLPVMFILQNAPQPTINLGDLSCTAIEQETHTAKFDLLFSLDDQPGMTGFFEYNADLFEPATIARLVQHFQTYLADMVSNPGQRLADIQVLSTIEQQELLVDWNDTRQAFPTDVTLQSLFTSQVAATPAALALIEGERAMTYQELDQQANQLAHLLRSKGVGPEVLVGLYAPRSCAQMIALLAILKAGGAYLPLDSAALGTWLAQILSDAQVALVLTTTQLRANLETYPGEVLCLDSSEAEQAEWPRTNPAVVVDPANLAYVIYTSGSTGKPKGVQITHRSIVNHCQAIQRQYHFSATDRVVQFASLSFDAAAEELYPTWASGATLVLRPSELATRIEDWHDWLTQMQISVLDIPTAYWHYWVTSLTPRHTLPACLRLVIVGGEQASPAHYTQWKRAAGTQVQWSNTYGPTETTVTSVWYIPTAESDASYESKSIVPIGRPLDNLTAYVLDQALQPVPLNVLGELYLGGSGVARGYLDRPDLTAERFVPDPFAQSAGSRLYRTGDLVRYHPGGILEYCGRSDQQVKIRGYRIEPGEIRTVLLEHAEVEDAVVIAREDMPGEKQLVAYITGSAIPEQSALRQFLLERLPTYMVPAAFVPIESIPVTTNGKVDVRALPAPDQASLGSQKELIAPRNAVEEVLALTWQELLGRTAPIGVEDNFFELGGHSLLATQLMARIDQIFSVLLPLRLLFEQPTVAHMATFLLQDEQEQEQILLTAQLFLQVEQLSEEELDALLSASDSDSSEELEHE